MDDDNLAMVRSTGCLKVVTFLTLSGSFLCCSERYSVLQNTSNGTLIGFVYLYICIFVYFVSLQGDKKIPTASALFSPSGGGRGKRTSGR